jgi:hypothetical protein
VRDSCRKIKVSGLNNCPFLLRDYKSLVAGNIEILGKTLISGTISVLTLDLLPHHLGADQAWEDQK